MFSRTNRTIKIALAGVALAALGGTAMADVVVTSSSGTAARQYPRGARLGDDQAVELNRGDVVNVVTPNGMRQWRGPGRFSASSGRQLASGNSTGSVNIRAGATRDANLPYPTVWDIDVSGWQGPFCYATDIPVALWRPDPSTAQTVTITSPDGRSETTTIAAERYSMPWPVTLAAAPEGVYTIELQGTPPVQVTFARLGTDSNDTVEIAASMGDHECFDQMDALVIMLAESGG